MANLTYIESPRDTDYPTRSDAQTDGGSVDGTNGAIRSKPVFSLDEVAAQLDRNGAGWIGRNDTNFYSAPTQSAPGVLTFGFFKTQADLENGYVDAVNNTAFTEYQDFFAFTDAQKAAARQAITAWDDVIAWKIVEGKTANADINFGNVPYESAPGAGAYAYTPYDFGNAYGPIYENFQRAAGDVWIVDPFGPSNAILDESFYGYSTMVHELGHSLGLPHPGDYNATEDGVITYDASADYYQDSYQYSIMSYFDGFETGAQLIDWNIASFAYNSTPGVHDILAIQRMYGADMTTRTGDTVYGFNSNAGRDDFDFAKTPGPVISIWDAGGKDTLDLSGYATPSVIDLNPGAFSSAGGSSSFLSLEEINVNRAAMGLPARTQEQYDYYKAEWGAGGTLMKDNISIAYGVTIENAVGGSGADLISGNAAANKLSGGAGSDTLDGRGGVDILTGGDGADLLIGGAGNDVFRAEVNATGKTSGGVSIDVIADFDQNGDDVLDFTGLKAKFAGSQTFDTVKQASDFLGIDLERYGNGSLDGDSDTREQSTTIVYGDLNRDGQADFAFALLGVRNVGSDDFWV